MAFREKNYSNFVFVPKLMDRIACKKCHIPYGKRRLVAHEAKCLGGINGFTPVKEKDRFFYRCHTCGLTVRKQGITNHQKRCSLAKELEKSTK